VHTLTTTVLPLYVYNPMLHSLTGVCRNVVANHWLFLLLPQVANPPVAALYEDALVYESGSAITSSGALTAFSGAKTGRSPSDKRIVQEPSSENEIWWGPVNRPMSTDVSDFSTGSV
jgi:ATP-dependent phosphoenolpyruvate carboxykinase